MKHIDTNRRKGFFKPLLATRSVQAAVMVLRPGQSSSDEPADEHPKAEQWLFVVSGTGRARGRGARAIKLAAGSLLLIEKDEPHQVTNTGRGEMVTINFYAPPAYDSDGKVKSTVRR